MYVPTAVVFLLGLWAVGVLRPTCKLSAKLPVLLQNPIQLVLRMSKLGISIVFNKILRQSVISYTMLYNWQAVSLKYARIRRLESKH